MWDVLRFSGTYPTPHPLSPCSRHPVRHISFNSHSLITANVPYEKVVRSADLDNFTTHRRSVGWACHSEKTIEFDFSTITPLCHIVP